MRHSIFIISILFWAPIARAEPDVAEIVTTLDVIMDYSKPSLLVTVLNATEWEIPEHPLFFNGNWFVILTPGGYIAKHGAIADVFSPKTQKMIGPGEQRSWEQPIDGFLEWPALADAGQYRLYWEYAGVRSREITLVRREASKKHPAFAPKVDPMDTPPTPRAALVTFLRWLDNRTENAAVKLIIDPDDVGEVVLRDTLYRRMMYMNQLRGAIEARKLPPGDDRPDWHIDASPEVVASIENASQTFSEYFDQCTLKGRGFSVRLVRDGVVWSICGGDLEPYIDFPAFDRTTEMIKQIANEILNGEYVTASQAAAALRALMKSNPKGTLQFTEAPSKEPAKPDTPERKQ